MASRRKSVQRSLFHIVETGSGARGKKNASPFTLQKSVAREILAILLAAFLLFTFLSISGATGMLGDAWFSFLRLTVGMWGLYSLLFLGVFLLVILLFRQRVEFDSTRILGIVLLELSFLGVVGLSGTDGPFDENVALSQDLGGYIGLFISALGKYFIQDTGTRVVLFSLFLVSALLIFQQSLYELWEEWREAKAEERTGVKMERRSLTEKIEKTEIERHVEKLRELEKKNQAKEESAKALTSGSNDDELARGRGTIDAGGREWHFPELDLLDEGKSEMHVNEETEKKYKDAIQDKLEQFNIPVTMGDVNVGPTVMQYTLKPAEGVKLSKITALKDDLALALASHSIRIEAPIPGKSLVGIEIPNAKRLIVRLREMIESKEFQAVDSTLRFPLGKDVSGVPVVEALDHMPHLLIAGATGAGKSVAINVFLVSVLYQNSPEDLRLVLVDPKRVELSGYNSIPHLLAPVITEPEKAMNALRWTVAEMMRRYKACQVIGARNRLEYNKKVADPRDRMPYIIFVIDELADLIMSNMRKEVETLICRIAQMARAVGIHLVIATQRPSVDVITGLIKANIPARISFSVVSSVDSRTILDSIGAEDLIGKGDMLYISPKLSKPMRVQGVFISSEEIEAVVTDIRMTSDPVFDHSIVEGKTSGAPGAIVGKEMDDWSAGSDLTDDTLCAQAVALIRRTKKISTTHLQTHLKLGFARANRIMQLLEEQGVIGPGRGAKPREIFWDAVGEE